MLNSIYNFWYGNPQTSEPQIAVPYPTTIQDEIDKEDQKPSSVQKEKTKITTFSGELRLSMLRCPDTKGRLVIRNLVSYFQNRDQYESIKLFLRDVDIKSWGPISSATIDNAFVKQFGCGYEKYLVQAYQNLSLRISQTETIAKLKFTSDMSWLMDIFIIKARDDDLYDIAYDRVTYNYQEGDSEDSTHAYLILGHSNECQLGFTEMRARMIIRLLLRYIQCRDELKIFIKDNNLTINYIENIQII